MGWEEPRPWWHVCRGERGRTSRRRSRRRPPHGRCPMEDGAMLMLGAGGSGALRLPRLNLREWVVAPLSREAAAGLWPVPGLRTSSPTDGAVLSLMHALNPRSTGNHLITLQQAPCWAALINSQFCNTAPRCKIKERSAEGFLERQHGPESLLDWRVISDCKPSTKPVRDLS